MALLLFANSDRPSPQVQLAAAPVPSPGDDGYYACTKLSNDEFSTAIGEQANGARPNGGKPGFGDQPKYSNCLYQTDHVQDGTGFYLNLTVASYPSADAATQALYQFWGDTPAKNIPGIGEGAFIFAVGSPAYVAIGSDVVELNLIAPHGFDLHTLATTLLSDVAAHADNPLPSPTAPVPGPNDLDPCLLKPEEVQAIFKSGPVTVTRVFAENPGDFACSYTLIPSLQYSIVIETASAASLAGDPTALQERYTSDRQSFSSATDIPGFSTPTAGPASGFADVWGFGNDSYAEVALNGLPPAAGPTGATPGLPIPPGSPVDFQTPMPANAYLASIIPTPGLTSSSVCGTAGVRCAADSSRFSVSGQGEGLNQ